MIIKVHTHPVVRDMHEEYDMNWCGKIINTKPKMKNGKPCFIIRCNESRSEELNTIDMEWLEKVAKNMTNPHGRKAVATDKAKIYIIEEDGKETLIGVFTHHHVKRYNQMFDAVEYK